MAEARVKTCLFSQISSWWLPRALEEISDINAGSERKSL